MTDKPRIYDPEFKARAVELARTPGHNVRGAARDLGIGYSTLTKWLSDTRRTPSSTPNRPTTTNQASLEEEVKRLRRENEVLRQEREILKP
jgi:transposase